MFGIPLEQTIYEGQKIPPIAEECISFLKTAVHEEGLFRLSGSEVEKEILISWWNQGYHVNLSNAPCPHLISGLFKNFLTYLSEPIMVYKLYDDFVSLETDSSDFFQKLEGFRVLLQKLPQENLDLLQATIELLVLVHNHRDTSKMNHKNLATVFGPVLFRPPPDVEETMDSVRIQTKLVKKLIKYKSALFCKVR